MNGLIRIVQPSHRKRPHNPWHTKGGYRFIAGTWERAPTQPAKAEPVKAAKPMRARRKRVKGGRPSATYRWARRNAKFGRKAKGIGQGDHSGVVR